MDATINQDPRTTPLPPISPAATLSAESDRVVDFIAARQREVDTQNQIKDLAELQNETVKLLMQKGKEIRSLAAYVEDLTFVIACLAHALGAQPKINHALLEQDMGRAAEQFWRLGAIPPEIREKIGASTIEATERGSSGLRPAALELALIQMHLGWKSR